MTLAIALCAVAACEKQEMQPEEPHACEVQRFGSEEVCFDPSACCEVGLHGMEALCEEYFPGQSTPVMCLGGFPTGMVCGVLPIARFDCEFGESSLVCCDVVP
jgi:hypothetical protein